MIFASIIFGTMSAGLFIKHYLLSGEIDWLYLSFWVFGFAFGVSFTLALATHIRR